MQHLQALGIAPQDTTTQAYRVWMFGWCWIVAALFALCETNEVCSDLSVARENFTKLADFIVELTKWSYNPGKYLDDDLPAYMQHIQALGMTPQDTTT